MPRYDFICPNGHTKEVNCKISEYDSEQYCDEPGFKTHDDSPASCDQPMDRVYSTFGIIMR